MPQNAAVGADAETKTSPPATPGFRFDGSRILTNPPPIQRKPTVSPPPGAAGSRNHTVPAPVKAKMEASLGTDFSDVRVHESPHAVEIGALAYTQGTDIHFAPGQYDPYSLDGQKLLGHELAHVVQQGQGRVTPTAQVEGAALNDTSALEREADEMGQRAARGESAFGTGARPAGGGEGANRGVQGKSSSVVVQMRRLPSNVGTLLSDLADPTKKAPNFDASSQGVLLLLTRAVAELTPAEVTTVVTLMLGGLNWLQFAQLPPNQIQIRASNALLAVKPSLTLGDPKLIDIGPRPGTADASNLKELVKNTKEKIFDAIISGSHDASLGEVFGAGNVDAAKKKYIDGRKWMMQLYANDKIVTDRSGYSGEVFLGGLTRYQTQISVSSNAIDKPTDADSIIVLVHESMHAGNSDVKDRGYIHQPSFTVLPEDVKLKNSAHFEVVPRRILGASYAFAGKTFIPAGTTVGGVTAPALTATEEAIRGASEALRTAWTIGLNLHKLFLAVYKDPTAWTTDQGGVSYADGLPFWSKVEKLTVHLKTDIDPAAANPAKHPVSEIDMALSEGTVRRLGLAMRSVPKTEADAVAFESANATPAEITAGHATVDTHRDFLMKLILKQPKVAPITGTVDRDFRMVQQFVNLTWSDVLKKRNPMDFAD